MNAVLSIACGGALGALLRHFMNNFAVHATGGSFPWGIFAVNVIGSFIMGTLVSLFAHAGDPPPALKLFLTVGLLGGFTTFSAFSLDAVMLIERGTPGQAAFYVAGSVLLAIGGLYGGMLLTRALLS